MINDEMKGTEDNGVKPKHYDHLTFTQSTIYVRSCGEAVCYYSVQAASRSSLNRDGLKFVHIGSSDEADVVESSAVETQ